MCAFEWTDVSFSISLQQLYNRSYFYCMPPQSILSYKKNIWNVINTFPGTKCHDQYVLRVYHRNSLKSLEASSFDMNFCLESRKTEKDKIWNGTSILNDDKVFKLNSWEILLIGIERTHFVCLVKISNIYYQNRVIVNKLFVVSCNHQDFKYSRRKLM